MLKNSKINSYGYIIDKNELSDSQINTLKADLTVKPFRMKSFERFSKNDAFPIYEDSSDQICVPKYYGIQKFGQPDVNQLETKKFIKRDMKYLGSLRDNQKVIVANIMKGFDEHRGGILVAGCGCGKTNMAIWLACELGLKTLFIVHKDFLKDQITKRIKSTTNIQKVGTIQGKKIDVDHNFVIGMIQSLTSKKTVYDRNIFKEFGLIIIDEVHHMGSKVYSSFFKKISSKYMLGISAENSRNDGMFKIINWFMGPILHFEEQKPNDKVIVKSIQFDTSNKKRFETIISKATKEPDRSTMITNLVYIKKRNLLIYDILKILFRENRRVLFLTGRRKHIEFMERLIKNDYEMAEDYGLYIGSMEQEELTISSKKRIILGTYNMAEEGLDIEELDVLVMTTPKSTVKQPIGRILRKEHDKNPLVIDIHDDNEIFKKQGLKRRNYYVKQQYFIMNKKIADFESKTYMMSDDYDGLKEFINSIPNFNDRQVICNQDDDDIEFLSDSD